MQILVFIDITDPWSFIGVTRLERASATFTISHGVTVEFGFRSVQLRPGEPAVPLQSAMEDRFGAARAQDEIAAAARAARVSGIDLNFNDAVAADTFDAHRLLAWAGHSDTATQQELLHQLWHAHWLEGADINDALVLSSRAALTGLDLQRAEEILESDEYADEVRAQTQAADDLNVADLPVIMVDAQWRLDGIHGQDDYVQALDRLWSQWSDGS